MDQNDIKNKINEKLVELLDLLGIKYEIEFVETDADSIKIEIKTEQSNLLIGYHGETLSSLQHILNVMLYKEFKEQARVVIDISGYRQERERKLIELAISASDKARFINKSVALYPMNSYERKIIHEKVSTLDGVSSISEGEGYSRRVIIVPESS
ncbi:hypothetical protein CO058_03380 [candidate division WWE3 bacterium CG_4_9_14_0_2_um_filter_35_11]|uniref:R3H domain-containing protein n=1 Tax=candidate division WWE3 bacterium CG_4_9_14_0_2_um_filter_35_11 TaxID=1975077 RepID=A0A2M8EL39_UNCKA|nr:MAG: hypothetical protein COV25_00775 [candidate division WWE3 bacterium CG10_big_fil_rev_8_21_14_0_10_35_32]PJC23449.1 MAG: hypothetical protein CO058_03380 [candidate division WWE3 bacterium CG_4_9_14_0_2_um_filter_35_11]